MPEVIVKYPEGMFVERGEREHFMTALMCSTAVHMDAINPATGTKTNFSAAPDTSIDLTMFPYLPEDARVTAAILVTVITYGWPDRMVNMHSRLTAIKQSMLGYVPVKGRIKGKDMISFTFLKKDDGCWVAG